MFKKQQKKKKGQSTLEYIILVTGVIAVLLIFVGPGGTFRQAFNAAMYEGTNGMENMAKRLTGSRPKNP